MGSKYASVRSIQQKKDKSSYLLLTGFRSPPLPLYLGTRVTRTRPPPLLLFLGTFLPTRHVCAAALIVIRIKLGGKKKRSLLVCCLVNKS